MNASVGQASLDHGTSARWRVLAATFLAYFYDSYDLAILSIALPVIIKILGVSLGEAGLLASATMIGAAAGSIVLGTVADNRGRRFVVVLSLVWFGVGTAFIYLVQNYAEWMILRFITGFAIGGVWGPCVALIARHWAPTYRARASAFMLSTFAIASAAAALVGRLVLTLDWRLLFLTGATAALIAIYVYFAVPDDSGRPVVDSQRESNRESVGLATIFSGGLAKYTILATLLNAAFMAGFWGAATWIPTYLVSERGLSLQVMANFSFVMYIGMFAGYQLLAYLGDKIGRKKALVIAILIGVVSIPIYLVVSHNSFLFWWGMVVDFSFGGCFGLAGAYYSELFPENVRALAGGFAFNVGRLGAVIAPYTVGLIAQQYGLHVGLIVAPVVLALGLIALAFLPETLKSQAHLGLAEG